MDAKNLVIEKGVTTIGAYSFYNKIESLENVDIADTVTTVKEYAFPTVDGTVEIPASVTRVETYAFSDVTRIVVKGDLKGYDYGAFGNWSTSEIVLGGTAEDLGKVCVDLGGPNIIIAKGNYKCTVKNGCLLSADGKELYLCIEDCERKIEIPDTVEKICDAAFYKSANYKIVFGKKVKEIGEKAFQNSSVHIIKFFKNPKKIGNYAFEDTPVKKVQFKGKVSIGTNAFDDDVVISNKAGIGKASTTITKCKVSSNKCYVNFAKVDGAAGYQIKIKAGKKTYKYETKTNKFKKQIDKKIKKYYKSVAEIYEEDSSVAITVTVRPYKVKKGKKVYGKNSSKAVLNW